MDAQLGEQLRRLLDTVIERNEGVDGLALDRVGHADHRRLGDPRVRNERRLDLGGAETVPGNIDHVVETAHDPKIAVLVAASPVAGIVKTGKLLEIGRSIAFRIAEHAAQHPGPRPADDQMTAFVGPGQLSFFIENRRIDAGQRPGRRPRFQGGRIGQRRDHDAAGLRLPPGIDNRQAAAADVQVIPHPGFRVNRLANRTENPQRRQVLVFQRFVAIAHQRPDDRRRGVEDGRLEFLDDLPETIRPRIGGHAFEHHRGPAQAQRPVEDVRVAGNPADIGGTPVDIGVLEVEHPLRRVQGIGQVAAGGMYDTLGFPGGTAGIENKQRILGGHRLRFTDRGNIVGYHFFVPPAVAAGLHPDFVAGAANDQAVLDRLTLFQCLVGIWFERNDLAGPQDRVGSHQDTGLTILNTVLQADRGKTGKDHRMDRADAGAGQQDNGQLGDHRQVDRYPVALFHPHLFQDIGTTTHFFIQLAIGKPAYFLIRLSLPDDRRFVPLAVGQMPINTIIRNIERRPVEPTHLRFCQIGIENPVPRREPAHQLACALGPIPFRIVH